MYTQCPDCSTAFRVTAEVLKQAAGKVRCGGCGNAFNALAFLSESMPEQTAPKEADEALPELTPEAPPSDGLPASISAEQSAALLKTLDELAGSDIRIEDTGVEWRVLDDDEIGDAAADELPVENPANEPANDADEDLIIDEILDESPTPVDQFLTETPAVVDSPEIFEEQPPEFSRTSVDEIRFDDNTPLPDDFELDDDGFVEGDFAAEASHTEALAENAFDDELEDVSREDPQVGLDLSEPDEWTDILGEFEDLAEAVTSPVEDELAAESEPEVEPEVETEVEPELEPELEPEPEAELGAPDIPVEDDSVDATLDMDSQFALQAEAMGIELSGVHDSLQEEQDATLEDDVDLDTLLRAGLEEEPELDDLLDEELVEEFDDGELQTDLEDITQLDLIDDDELDAESREKPEDEFEDQPDQEPETEFEEEPDVEPETEFEEEPDQEHAVDEREQTDAEGDSGKHYVPPMSEEEQTINMQIDQDLLALAVEDEDGFASTIIVSEDAAEASLAEEPDQPDDDEADNALVETGAGFETIIMEGEAFRSTEDLDKLEADSMAAVTALAASDREAEQATPPVGRRYGIIGGIIFLLLLLAVQYVHQARDTLATIPAFNSAVGPLYRAIGQPLSPAWDITGWRFEVAKGTEEDDESLTIYSRLGNNSDSSLPYPLIGISLTDRFEETIGSRVLDPDDYLADDLDPRKLVEPGNTFEAVITIPTPAEATAGFRLRACYRATDGQLRCKDDGFK